MSANVQISLRRYSSAIGRLKVLATDGGRRRSVPAVRFPIEEVESANSHDDVVRQVNAWVAGGSSDQDRFVTMRLVFCVLRRLMEIHLLRYEVCQLLRFSGRPCDTSEENILKTKKFYVAARMLLRFTTEEEYSALGAERCRVHSILAGALAVSGDLEGVQRSINEALISIHNLPESEESIANSVVDLRRVYCKLWELFRLEGVREYSIAKFDGNVTRPSIEVEATQAAALLEDIRLLLERVDARMSRGRKTLWWWMTLRRYQLVWLQHRELLRAWQTEKGDGPKIDRDQVSYRDAELGQSLLAETVRRVVADVYQLARIASAGLAIAQMGPKNARGNWLKVLKEADERMTEILRVSRIKRAASDPEIEDYVKLVQEKIGHFEKKSS